MSTPWVVLGVPLILLTALTTALVLVWAHSGRSERALRRQIAADIRAHAAQVARFPAAAQFATGLNTAARIAEGMQMTTGFVTSDSSGNVRKAGDWRRSS